MYWLELISLGLLIGGMSSIFGIGGGVLLVPILPWLFPLNQKEAIGTSLVTIFFLVSFNTYGFHRQKIMPWRIVLVVGLFAALFSFAAGRLTLQLSDEILKIILATVMGLLALRVYRQRGPTLHDEFIQTQSRGKLFWAKVLFLGAASGASSGLTGVGAGLIMSPALLAMGLVAPGQVSPASNGIMMFTTLFAVLALVTGMTAPLVGWRWGLIHLDMVVILFVTAMFVAFLGQIYQKKVSFRWRKYFLASLLVIFAVKEIIHIMWKSYEIAGLH